MGTTQPIRNLDELAKFTEYYHSIHPNLRNYTLIVLGLHTALRISDVLHLQWNHVYDFESGKCKDHLYVIEQKTGKRNNIALCDNAKNALAEYFAERQPQPDEYVFSKNTSRHTSLSRSQAYRIVRTAAENSIHAEHVSCHSLRKTFGYHAWKQGVPPALLMEIYNHSSYEITKRYLGITQDEKDGIFLKIQF